MPFYDLTMKKYLLEQLNLHPSIKPRDVVKLCYQGVFGAEHLLFDEAAERKRVYDEYACTEPREMPIFEQISDDFCRVNIAAWKKSGLCAEWLFNMFLLTAKESHGDKEAFLRALDEAAEYIGDYKEEYLSGGICAVHHSEEYRVAERPAYRVVSMRIARLIPVLKLINADTHIIAIDGRAASGKTTAAYALCKILGAADIHMDDFFLPPELRNESRMAEIGGNVHYERFAKEVLPNLRGEYAFEYGVFDCSKMALCEKRQVSVSKIKVVEGAYSHHPHFGDYADIKVFSLVDSDEQMHRIFVRNGEEMAKMFKEKWIPMEEAYFEKFKIKKNADIVI